MCNEPTVQVKVVVQSLGKERLFEITLEEPFPILENEFLLFGCHKFHVGKHGLCLHKMFLNVNVPDGTPQSWGVPSRNCSL